MKPVQMLLAVVGVLGAVPALAQDAPPPPPSDTATDIDPTFTGPRVEGFGGVDFQKYDFNPNPAGAERTHTGGVAGALAGYDIGFRNFVVGAFGSYALPTSNSCDSSAQAIGRCVRPEREIEAGARIGFKGGDSFLGNRFMVYAKGAYVNTSVKVQSGLNGGGIYNTHRLIGGWRAGAGAEYALTENAYVKVEYDYTRTGRFSLEPYGFADTEYRQSKNQVLAGFGVRF